MPDSTKHDPEHGNPANFHHDYAVHNGWFDESFNNDCAACRHDDTLDRGARDNGFIFDDTVYYFRNDDTARRLINDWRDTDVEFVFQHLD